MRVTRQRKQPKRQSGFGVIAFLGLMAALAVGSAGLVVLIDNSATGTYTDTSRAKSFNVAEGALNVAMATLQANWPTTLAMAPAFPTSSFRAQYSASKFPNPTSGSFISVQFFDDSDTNGDGVITPGDAPYDAGAAAGPATPDNEMYVRATARVGNAAATVQGLVQRTLWNPTLPRGLAAYSGGQIYSNSQGGGTMPKVGVEVPPPPTVANPTGTVAAYAVSGYSPSAIMQAGTITPITGSGVPPVDQVISPTTIAGIKNMAIQGGRYFSGSTAVADALNSPQSAMGGPGLQGLTYIEPTTGTSGSIALPANTIDNPGVLFLMGGNGWNFNNSGNADSYGFFYTQGNFDFARGTVTVHGSIICTGDVGFKGTPQTLYNDNVWIKLTQQWTLNVRLVPNSWRELTPGATN